MSKFISVSERALFARVSRMLAKDGEKLHRAKYGSRAFLSVGLYYIVDSNNVITATNCDLEKLAREIKVIAEWEKLEVAEENPSIAG